MTGAVPDCRFCLVNGLIEDGPVSETNQFYVLMSNNPALREAAMVIPHRHSETPFDLTPGEWADLPNALLAARDLLDRFEPEGFNIGWNVGALAGQNVFHTHMHVIARRSGTAMDGRGIRHAFKATSARDPA